MAIGRLDSEKPGGRMDGQLDGQQTWVDEILPGTIDQNLRTGKILPVRGDDLEADGEPEACPYAVVIVVRCMKNDLAKFQFGPKST